MKLVKNKAKSVKKANIIIARDLLKQGYHKAALLEFRNLQKEHINDAEFWLEYALAAADSKRYKLAAKCIKICVTIKPDHHLAFHSFGLIKTLEGSHDIASVAFGEAFKIKPIFKYGANYADALLASGNYQECKTITAKLKDIASTQSEKDNVALLEANILLNTGNSEQAIKILKERLDSKTSNYRILREYFAAKKAGAEDKSLIEQYQQISTNVKVETEYGEDIFLALGKAYADLGEYEKSAKSYLQGKAIASDKRKYNGDGIRKFIDNSTRIFTPELIAKKQLKAKQDKTPIFVVGMARSGTTLLEQILSTSKNVHACGELPNIAHLAKRTKVEIPKKGFIKFPESMELASEEYLLTCKNDYLGALNSINKDAKYYVDKMPSNINFLGFINTILPEAKVIHIKRDLRDVALSIFQTSFKDSGMQFANKFEDIIDFIEQYLKAQKHWKNIIPNAFVEINYADLVTNFDDTTKKVFEYCGLEWSENAKNFHNMSNDISTASRSQVKQPLYKSSLNKWEKYQPYFGMYFDEIKKLAEKYGY